MMCPMLGRRYMNTGDLASCRVGTAKQACFKTAHNFVELPDTADNRQTEARLLCVRNHNISPHLPKPKPINQTSRSKHLSFLLQSDQHCPRNRLVCERKHQRMHLALHLATKPTKWQYTVPAEKAAQSTSGGTSVHPRRFAQRGHPRSGSEKMP